MLGLYRKFAEDVATVRQPRRMAFFGGVVYPNDKRELICRNEKTAFVVADDVYMYYVDNEALWYAKGEDLSRGIDAVYRIDVNNIFDLRKGIIDKDGYFLYVDNGYMYCETRIGDAVKLCALESVGSLLTLTGKRRDMTVEQLEGILGAECGYRRYTETAFYKDIACLHSLVGELVEERGRDWYASPVSAQIIATVIRMCCEMKKTVSQPLTKLVQREWI